MKKQYGTLLIIPILTIGCWSLASAAKEAAVTFDQIDTNGDGYISKEEAKVSSDISKNWTKVDKDKNGQVDISEFSAFEGQERYTPPSDMEEPEPGAAPF